MELESISDESFFTLERSFPSWLLLLLFEFSFELSPAPFCIKIIPFPD